VVLAYAIILLVVLALLLRRDLSGMGRVSFKGGWKLIVVIAALFLLQWNLVLFAPGQTVLQMSLLVLSQLALVFLFLLNRHVPGARFFALGIALNTAVMVANGGWMPVTPETYKLVHPDWPPVEVHSRPPDSKNIVLPQAETKLWILSDIIPVILPDRGWALSVGDVLLIFAAAQFIFQTTKKETSQPADVPRQQ
jgi:hypothetical protein